MNPVSAPIIHPTDFSDASMNAFAHALKIGLVAKCRLYVVHVAERKDADDWQAFPHVRRMLARWGVIEANAPTAAIFDRLGVEVAKVEIEPQDPVRGLVHFLQGHPSDLMVLATHGRDGLPRWLRPSIAEALSRRTHMQTLFIPPHGAGFVDEETGAIDLKHVLFPIDHHPAAGPALGAINRFCRALGAQPGIRAMHIGADAPVLSTSADPADIIAVELYEGNVVDNILQAAAALRANLIGMATAGHHGLLDALRGSTTERVLRHSPCPVLAIPAV